LRRCCSFAIGVIMAGAISLTLSTYYHIIYHIIAVVW
jgi:hypothetical protein